MLEQRAQLVRSYLISTLGFPFWHSGYEPACRCRGHGFDPWSGEFSHAVLGATKPVNHNYSAQVLQVLKPEHPESVLRTKRSHHNEEPTHRRNEK